MDRYFNPRTHEGCDIPGEYKKYAVEVISIHAPAKGATSLENYI